MNTYIKTLLLTFASLAAAAALLALSTRVQAETPEKEAISRNFSPIVSPEIPMSMEFAGQKIDLSSENARERLDRELTSMAYSHGTTMLALKRANKWFPVLAPILKEQGVHSDLLYLAVIESTLDPRAYSPAKAAGLWQFIPSTAREYGLEVNEYVDERLDPVKSTRAACRFLKSARAKHGNWESAAAGYNAGQARISKEIAAQGEDSAYALYLPNETMRYIYRLLAQKLIFENPSAYGYRLTADDLYQPVKYREVAVSDSVPDWPEWARRQGINYLTLREHNPWIISKSLPNKTHKTYTVRIPDKESLTRKNKTPKTFDSRWLATD